MDKEKVEFFATGQNQKILKAFLAKVNKLDYSSEKGKEVILTSLKVIIESIIANAPEYDEKCINNIQWIGNQFISRIQNFSDTEEEKLWEQVVDIFTSSYRYLCELEFSISGNLNDSLRRIRSEIDEHLHLFNEREKSQITYASLVMPIELTKRFINHKNIGDFNLFNERYDAGLKLVENWNKELIQKEKDVNLLKEKLDEQKVGFNFVGLYKGFNDLSANKISEKNWAVGFLIFLGILALVPVGIEIYLFLFHTSLIKDNVEVMIYSIVPMITLQLILVYFFRVSLFNFKSIKAQLLQIELRKTLCQFIQSYADYSKEIKVADKSSLEKFENLIFSGLISNEENLPSTFDGIEQIGKIIQSIKS